MDSQATHDPTCPFCPFSDPDGGFVTEHVRFCHPENGLQPDIEVDVQRSLEQYVDCPHGCGEMIAAAEISYHLDLHVAEEIALEDTPSPQAESLDCGQDASYEDSVLQVAQKSSGKEWPRRRVSPQESSPKGSKSRSPNSTATDSKASSAGGVKRLGRAELGPHAHERQMPSWLRKMLQKGAKATQSITISSNGTLRRNETVENETTGVIPVLARLCEQDKSVQRAFLCSPSVCQVSKMSGEGGFCGYRNIQMLVSYIKQSGSPGHERFTDNLPTILQLQDMIENAWDMGYNSVGRVETGGIRGTRKYIGTPEAQALFSSLGIRCEACSIGESKEMRAHDALLTNVANYFRQTYPLDESKKVVTTKLPPIYFQHQGHSLTIIGFEIRDGGSANLLVFDPMFKPPSAVKRLKETHSKSPNPAQALKGYRRGTVYLQKYKVFEILKLSIPTALH